MSFRHLVKAANAASLGWQLSESRGYLAALVPAPIVAPVPATGGRLVAKRLLCCWRGDLATSCDGGESFRRWVFFAVDISRLDKAARLLPGDSHHHGGDCEGVDDAYQSSMCEWNDQLEVATI